MAVFCFKCPACGFRMERLEHSSSVYCPNSLKHGEDEFYAMQRDYRSEAVGIGAGVRVSRDGTVADQARAILPDNSDFAGPGDPDGTKGMRRWHEEFQPTGSRPPTVGSIERQSF